jgi:hypothetical protein
MGVIRTPILFLQGVHCLLERHSHLSRLLSQTPAPSRNVGLAIIESLCVCARQLGRQRWVPLYHDAVRNVIIAWQNRVMFQGGDATAMEQPGRLQPVGLGLYGRSCHRDRRRQIPIDLISTSVQTYVNYVAIQCLTRNPLKNSRGNVTRGNDA